MRGVMLKISMAMLAIPLVAPMIHAQRDIVRPSVPPEELRYGSDALQRLDYWRGAGKDAPLILFVHGGGWSRGDKRNAIGGEQVPHFTGAGYAFASVGYHLVPDAKVEDQAQDVADAIAFLIRDADRLNLDRRKIVLMGHSAGAHLAALVGTDPRYLERAGLKTDIVGGVVLLDGAGYDVARQMDDAGPFLRRMYNQAFGNDPVRQRALSPTLHAGKPNADSFLILHVNRADSRVQSEALGAALRSAGTPARVEEIVGENHMTLNRGLGAQGDQATALIDAFAGQVFAYKGDWKRPKLVPVRE